MFCMSSCQGHAFLCTACCLLDPESLGDESRLLGCFRIAVPTFQEKHGMRACMVAPTKIIAGLGMSLGIDRLHAPGTTGKTLTSCNHAPSWVGWPEVWRLICDKVLAVFNQSHFFGMLQCLAKLCRPLTPSRPGL